MESLLNLEVQVPVIIFGFTQLFGAYSNNSNSVLETPVFDISSLADPYVQFNMIYEIEPNFDVLRLQYSLDGGAYVDVAAGSTSRNFYRSI